MNRLAIALALLTTTADARTIRITNNHGGVFQEFQRDVDQRTARGDRIIIDGRCDSACVMYLAVPGACVTRRAVLGLHSTSGPDYMRVLMNPLYASYLPLPMRQRYLAEWQHIMPGNPVHRINSKTAVRLGARLCAE